MIESVIQKMIGIQTMVQSGKKLPLMGENRLVDSNAISDAISDIIQLLPKSLEEADKVLLQEQKIVTDATDWATETRERAEATAKNLIQNTKEKIDKEQAASEAKINQSMNDAINNAKLVKGQAQEMASKLTADANKYLQDANDKAHQLIDNAENQAMQIIEKAKLDAKKLVSEHEILRKAQAEAESLMKATQDEVDKMYDETYGHIDDVLGQLEIAINDKLTSIRTIHNQVLNKSYE